MCVCVCLWMCVFKGKGGRWGNMYVLVCVCVCLCLYVCVHEHMRMCARTASAWCMYKCVWVCACVRVCVRAPCEMEIWQRKKSYRIPYVYCFSPKCTHARQQHTWTSRCRKGRVSHSPFQLDGTALSTYWRERHSLVRTLNIICVLGVGIACW